MKHYRIDSVFRDAAGRELFRKTPVWKGEEADARCALAEAHKAMATIVAADPRVDMVATTVQGTDGETITTTDYADELGSGASSSGLMEEVAPEDLDGRGKLDPTVEGLPAPTIQGDETGGAYAPGGAEPAAADTFRRADSTSSGGASSGTQVREYFN